jgi:hypothetical protein
MRQAVGAVVRAVTTFDRLLQRGRQERNTLLRRAALGGEDGLESLVVAGHAADPVDRIGREGHQPAAAQHLRGHGNARLVRVQPVCHGPILAATRTSAIVNLQYRRDGEHDIGPTSTSDRSNAASGAGMNCHRCRRHVWRQMYRM